MAFMSTFIKTMKVDFITNTFKPRLNLKIPNTPHLALLVETNFQCNIIHFNLFHFQFKVSVIVLQLYGFCIVDSI